MIPAIANLDELGFDSIYGYALSPSGNQLPVFSTFSIRFPSQARKTLPLISITKNAIIADKLNGLFQLVHHAVRQARRAHHSAMRWKCK